jgi:hypothetical protein
MKPVVFILALVCFITVHCTAQNKVDRYCEIILSSKAFSMVKFNVTVNFGEHPSLVNFTDTTVKSKVRKVETFTNSVDVLNYMTNLGWTLVNTFNNHNVDTRYYIFKRTFDASEIKQ